jgi:DNA-binding transcriptional LysR family regulator
MNLQQLAIFREVIKTGSVSQAARNMGCTQPAISASLKALE